MQRPKKIARSPHRGKSPAKPRRKKSATDHDELRHALAAARVGDWSWTPASDRLRLCHYLANLLGLSKPAALTLDQLLARVHPDDRTAFARLAREAARRGTELAMELRVVLPNGSIRWMIVQGHPLGRAKTTRRFIGLMIDITERKSSDAWKKLLEKVNDSVGKLDSPGEIKTTVANLTGQALGVTRCLFGEIDSREEYVVIEGNFTSTVVSVAGQHRLNDFGSPLLKELKAGRTLAINDVEGDERLHAAAVQAFARIQTRAILAVPLVRDKRLAALFVLHHATPRTWLGDEISGMEEVARRTFLAIEHARAEAALRQSEARFRGTFENAAVGIAHIAEDGSWLEVNQRLCTILGYSREELLGHRFQEITHADDLVDDLNFFNQLFRQEVSTYHLTKRFLHKNNDEIWVTLTNSLQHESPDRTYCICVVEDITERRRNQGALEIQARVLSSMAEGVSLADEDGSILYTNPAEDRMFGYDAGELIGQHVTIQSSSSPEEGRRIYSEIGEYLKTNSIWAGEFSNQRKDGSRFVTFARISVFEMAGQKFWICVQEDISERKRAETALQQAQTQLKNYAHELEQRVLERTAELQETIKSLEGFCYSIAHDLRAPLRAAKGFTQILLQDYAGSFDDVGRDYARRIVGASERMDQLIQDLLDYGRLTHVELSFTDVQLDGLVKSVVANLADEIQQQGAKIDVTYPLGEVRANALVLEQAILNLLHNALKFVAPLKSARIAIWAEQHERRTRVFIKDNGIGISPEHHERIFRVFERLHGVDRFPGTGIGLAIVQKGLERMGGRVGLESRADEGSCFWIELPTSAPA